MPMTFLKRLQIPTLGIALNQSEKNTPPYKISLALLRLNRPSCIWNYSRPVKIWLNTKNTPATYVLESPQMGINPITVNVVETRGRNARLSSSQRSASMPPIKQRPTSSASGVCQFASPTTGPSLASTPIIGMNMTGASPAGTPGIESVSSGPPGPVLDTFLASQNDRYDSKFKVVLETTVGYRLVQGARVPIMDPKTNADVPNMATSGLSLIHI